MNKLGAALVLLLGAGIASAQTPVNGVPEALGVATSSAFGVVECGSGTTCTGGVISASGGGGASFTSVFTGPSSNPVLSAAATSSATTLSVASTTGFSATGYLYVGGNNYQGEFVSYTGLTSTSFTGVTRGLFGITAQPQTTSAIVEQVSSFSASSLSASPAFITMFNGPTFHFPTATFMINQTSTGQGDIFATPGTAVAFAGGATFPNGGNLSSDANGGTLYSAGYSGEWNGAGTLTSYNNSTFLASATNITSTTFVTTGLALPTVQNSNGGNMIDNQITKLHGRCVVGWHQATAGTVQFAIKSSVAPAALTVFNNMLNSTYSAPTTTIITTTTVTAISAVTTPGAYGTSYQDDVDFTITVPSAATTVTLYGLTSASADTLTIEANSTCGWLL